MNDIITRDDMAVFIKGMLGAPVLEIELEQGDSIYNHINLAIDNSLLYFFNYDISDSAYADYMVVFLRKGIIEYDVPKDVMGVVDCYTTSFLAGVGSFSLINVGVGESLISTVGWNNFDLVTYVGAMRYLADVQKLVGESYDIHLNQQQGKLRIFPTPRSDKAVMVKIYRKSKISEVFKMPLFRKYVVASTKIIWGEIITRDTFTFPGGGTVNGAQLLANAREDVEKIEKEIWDRSAKPFILTDLS